MTKLLIFFSLFFGATSSFAVGGDYFDKGNAGFILVCDGGRSHTTFDIHELRTRYQERFTEDKKVFSTVTARVDYLISKLDRLNPTRAALYRGWAKSFYDEALWVDNNSLQPIPDIGFGRVPLNCKLELGIYQREPSILNSQRYTIRRDLWNKLDIRNQAALVMHELIYREASNKDNRHYTSEASRYFNAWLNSVEFSTVSYKKYLTDLQQLHFSVADFNGFQVLLGRYRDITGKWAEAEDLDFYDEDHLVGFATTDLNAEALSLIPVDMMDCYKSVGGHEYGYLRFDRQGQLLEVESTLVPFKKCYRPFGDAHGTRGYVWGTHFIFRRGGELEMSATIKVLHSFYMSDILIEIVPDVTATFYFDVIGVLRELSINAQACRDIESSTPKVKLEVKEGFGDYQIFLRPDSIQAVYKNLPFCQ